jgi:hypothetical protein
MATIKNSELLQDLDEMETEETPVSLELVVFSKI